MQLLAAFRPERLKEPKNLEEEMLIMNCDAILALVPYIRSIEARAKAECKFILSLDKSKNFLCDFYARKTSSRVSIASN